MKKPTLATLMSGMILIGATSTVQAIDGGPYDFSFTAPGGTIPDEGIGVFPLVMTTPVSFIASLELEINDLSHDSIADVDMYLISPFGRYIEIMTDRGGMNAVSNLDLVFSNKASSLPGTPMMSGTYSPEGFNNETDAGFDTFISKTGGPGSWILLIVDDAAADTGSIGSFSLRGTVPEPVTLSLLGIGALAALRRRRSR